MTDLIERELDLPASPADVWRAMTDPAWLSGWLADEVELELKPGGDARFVLGEELRTGWIEEVSPPQAADGGPAGRGRLAFWWARGDEPASRVELELVPINQDSTRLKVTETRPLEILDLIGIPLPGNGGAGYGPALMVA